MFDYPSTERMLLEVQRLQMERTVSEQVAEERRALLASRMAAMHAEVEKKVAEERTAMLRQPQQGLSQTEVCGQ